MGRVFSAAGAVLLLLFVRGFSIGGWATVRNALVFSSTVEWGVATTIVMALLSGVAAALALFAASGRNAWLIGVACAGIALIALPKMHDAWRREQIVAQCDRGDIESCERSVSFGGAAATIADDRVFEVDRKSVTGLDHYRRLFPSGRHTAMLPGQRDSLYANALGKLKSESMAKALLETLRRAPSHTVAVRFSHDAPPAGAELFFMPDVIDKVEAMIATHLQEALTSVTGDGLFVLERNASDAGAVLNVHYAPKRSGKRYTSSHKSEYEALLFDWRIALGDGPVVTLSSLAQAESYNYHFFAETELLQGAFADMRRKLVDLLTR